MDDLTKTLATEFNIRVNETFFNVEGYYLDRGTSLLQTLSGLTAEQASKLHPTNGESVAAHVIHLIFYIDVVEEYTDGRRTGKTDWDESWKVKIVDTAEWAALLTRLEAAGKRLETMASTWDWSDAERSGNLMSMLVHTGFHLGALRQILDTIR